MRLRMAIARLARNLRQQSDSELTPSQQILLATILDHGPATPTELAAREQVSAPTISRARLGDLDKKDLERLAAALNVLERLTERTCS